MLRASLDALRSDALLGSAADAAGRGESQSDCSQGAALAQATCSAAAVEMRLSCGRCAVLCHLPAGCARRVVHATACGKMLPAARRCRCRASRTHNAWRFRMSQMERHWGNWTMRTSPRRALLRQLSVERHCARIGRHSKSIGLSPENLRQDQALARVSVHRH